MLRLKANKTALYKLVADYVDNLPPMRSGTEFIKYPRTPDYALNWITPEWNTAHAFFSTCMGHPLLSIEIRDGETGKTASRTTYSLTLRDLRERGMVEEFVTAAERRRIEGVPTMADFLPLPEKEYSVIYADPPWEYRQHGTTEKSRGTALKQYPTMTTADICNLPVRKICGGGGQPVFYGRLSQTLPRGSGSWRRGGFSTRPRPLCG